MMMEKEIHVGDKFIIEVGETEWHPTKGNRYWIKGFNTLVFDDCGIKRLEPYKEPLKVVPHTCEFCKYNLKDSDEMPCMICNKNDFQPRDMFEVAE